MTKKNNLIDTNYTAQPKRHKYRQGISTTWQEVIIKLVDKILGIVPMDTDNIMH